MKRSSRKRSISRSVIAIILSAIMAFPVTVFAEEVVSESDAKAGSAESGIVLDFNPSESSDEAIVEWSSDAGEMIEADTEQKLEDENTAETFDALPNLNMKGTETYLAGFENGMFYPDKTMTRAQFCTLIYNALATKPTGKANQYSDVPNGKWYTDIVNALASAGIIAGYSDGTFAPNKNIKRAEVIAICAQFFEQGSASLPYTDVSSSHWAYKQIITAQARGWIQGDGTGLFRPDGDIKRSEVVKITNLVLERDVKKSDKQKFPDVPSTHWAYDHINNAAKEPTVKPTPTPSGDQVITTTGSLRLRSGPSTDHTILKTMSSGEILTVLDRENYLPWFKVKTSDNIEGYVHSDYVKKYDPSTETPGGNGTISTSSVTLARYKTVYLYAEVDGNATSALWKTSNDAVAQIKTLDGRAFVYGRAQGSATISLVNSAGTVLDTCTVTVTAPDAVRFTYADPNTPTKGQDFYVYAITDTTRTEVRFDFSGAATASTTCKEYSTETRTNAGYDTNNVRVFKQKVKIEKEGDYVVKAYSKDGSGNWSTSYAYFNMLVKSNGSLSETTSEERSVSAEMIDVIATWEGAYNLVYLDKVATGWPPTVGYGYLISKNESFYNSLTQSELRAMLQDTLNNDGYVAGVKKFQKNNGIKLNQYQFDALVSFAYNLGPNIFSSSYNTFKVMLNASSKTSGAAKLNIKDLPMYSSASASGASLVTVPNGTSVTVQSITRIDGQADNLWYKVSYGGKTGWIRGGGVTFSTSSPDLKYIDEQMFGSNLLEWNSAGSSRHPGLVYRRLAEAKVFCYGGYADAKNVSSNSNNRKNFGLDIPTNVPGLAVT